MQRKLITRYGLLAMGFLLAIGLAGCQSLFGVDDEATTNFDDLAFAVAGWDDLEANIQDATLDTEMKMNSPFRGGRFGRGPGFRGSRGSHLGGILRDMEITESQAAAIRDLISAHRESVREPIEALRAANQEIIDAARTERRAVMDQVRSGELTREEAKEQLKALSEAKRQAIAENPDNAPYLEAICASKAELHAGIRALLTETQQEQWDAWLAGLESRCSS